MTRTASTATARKNDTISRRRSRRMPRRQALEQDGVRASDLRDHIEAIQGDRWRPAFDLLHFITVAAPVGTQAATALTLEAIARRLSDDDAPSAAELFQGLLGLHYITADPVRMRICYQLLLQAENDATGPTGDRDRFAEFTTDHPRDAITILLYALAALTH